MQINTCEAQMANLVAFSKRKLAKKYDKIKIIIKVIKCETKRGRFIERIVLFSHNRSPEIGA